MNKELFNSDNLIEDSEYQEIVSEAKKLNIDDYTDINYTKSGINAYLNALKEANIEILSDEQFKQYFTEYKKNGNKSFRDKIILGNIKLIISIAKRYKRICKSMQLEDLIQEGVFGLMTAIDKYEIESGYKFSTYAYYWIRQKIYSSIQNSDRFIRVPTSISNEMIKFTEQYNKLQDKGIEVTLDDFKKAYSSYYRKRGGKEKIKSLWENYSDFKSATDIQSLNITVGEEDSSLVELGDLIEDKSTSIEKIVFENEYVSQIQKIIKKACEHLYSKNSEKIKKVYYIINHTFGFNDCEVKSDIQIGKDLRITKERVNQLRDKVLRYMKYMKELKREKEAADIQI